MRPASRVAYAARAMRGFFALNLPVTAAVRRDFRLDFSSGVLFGLFNGSAVGYIYVVARTIGASQIGISVLVAMGAVGAMLSLPASLMIKGGGGRTFMFASWAIGRGCMIFLLLLSGPTPYMVLATLYLISSGIAGPVYAQVMQDIYPREFRGRLMSLVRVGSGTSTTIASLVTAWLLGSGLVSFQTLFAVTSAVALVSLYVFSKVTPVRPPPRPRQSMRDTFAILRRDRAFARFQMWVFFMGSGNIVAGTLYPLVIVDKLHAGYGPFGVLSVITALGYLSSFFVWGRVVDRKGPVFTMLVVGICVLVLPAGMIVAPSVYWLLPIMFITGVANAGFEIGPFTAVMHYSLAAPHDVPRYMALHSYLAGVRGLIFPFVATLILAGRHYTLSISTAFVISAIGVFMLWQLFATQVTSEPEVRAHPHKDTPVGS